MQLWEAGVPEERFAELCRIWETADTVPTVLRFGKVARLPPPVSSWAAFSFPSVRVALVPLEAERKAKFSWKLGLGY